MNDQDKDKELTMSEYPFEAIKHIREEGRECWSSREFARVLGYMDYREFERVLDKARTACRKSGGRVEEHFTDILESAEGGGGQQEVKTTYLSRYACYLVIQNADPSREAVALGQSYFAIQTRRQELARQAAESRAERESRLLLRRELKVHNIKLAGVAREAGVVEPADYATFQNFGYAGLYGGLDAPAIRRRKGIKGNQHILDHMGSTELAANLFRATQAEELLRRENVHSRDHACQVHREVGERVRQTIERLGGTLPENLPSAVNIRMLENRRKDRKSIRRVEKTTTSPV